MMSPLLVIYYHAQRPDLLEAGAGAGAVLSSRQERQEYYRNDRTTVLP